MAYYGVYFGVVTNNNDPQRSGRVQIRLPLLGSTAWAPVASSETSTPLGVYSPGAQVIVAFERGDESHPVVLGRVQDAP